VRPPSRYESDEPEIEARRDQVPFGVGVFSAFIFLALPIAGALDRDHLVGAIIGLGAFAVVLPFMWRSGVYVTDTGITCVPIFSRPTTYEWSGIKGFKVDKASAVFGIYVIGMDGKPVVLPSTTSTSSLKPKMERVCQALDAARSQTHAEHPQAPAVAASPDLRAARDKLASQRPKLALISVAAVVIAAGGSALLHDSRFWLLAVLGAVAIAGLIPIQIGLMGIDRKLSEGEPGSRPAESH